MSIASSLPLDRSEERKAQSVVFLLSFASEYLNDESVTEICVNRPGEIWCERSSGWEKHDHPELTLEAITSLITAIAKYADNDINESLPLLSATLPGRQRVQVVMPPACEEGTCSITIRKPSHAIWDLEYFKQSGFFDRVNATADQSREDDQILRTLLDDGKTAQFLQQAVQYEKVIVVSGETGSGKTTLMKALAQEMPVDQRIITIEDVPELFLPQHPNHVHLFYRSEATGSDAVTATTLLKSVMRMKPSRIILAEVRGGETFDFVNAAASGHGGSITSCHAGSCDLTFRRLEMMMLQNPQGQAMPHQVIRNLLDMVIDVVVHVHNDTANGTGRHVSNIWFDPHSLRSKAGQAMA